MELEFIKVGSRWVAEFTATGNFNLHIEKGEGSLGIYQSSVEGGKYDYVRQLNIAQYDKIVDVDFVGAIFPKWIKVESKSMPTMAVVTMA